MRFDVTALGELVIDLMPLSSKEGLSFVAKPGGAPGNVAAGVARLGLKSAMISKVGDEAFGRAAVDALAATGVDTGSVVRSAAHNTALAVVAKNTAGEAGYIFYRENCADSNLSVEDVPLDLVASSRVLHVGTLLLATPISAAAQRHAVAFAKAEGVLVSTDVNFRTSFWRDLGVMRDAGLEMVAAAAIVKVSRDELFLMTGIGESAAAVRSLWHDGLIVFAVTLGAQGAAIFTESESTSVPGFDVETVDTVGCGDAFMASLLADLVERDLHAPSGDDLKALANRACAAGAIVATRSGALESMPDRRTIDEFLSAHRQAVVPGASRQP